MTKYLLLAALFGSSFFMPAYAGDSEVLNGWGCLKYCWNVLGDPHINTIGVKSYYFGFILTNILFVLVLYFSAQRRRRSIPGIVISFFLAAHVGSWWFINLGERLEHAHSPIYYGYFVWLAAYLGLLGANLLAKINPGNLSPRAT